MKDCVVSKPNQIWQMGIVTFGFGSPFDACETSKQEVRRRVVWGKVAFSFGMQYIGLPRSH